MRTKTIDELVEDALTLCREQGFTEASIYAKHKVFKAIIRKHKENGCDTYNADLLAEWIMMFIDVAVSFCIGRKMGDFQVL